MLKIDRDKKTFSKLNTPKLAEVAITERYDLQEFISNSPEVFFNELGLELFLVGKELTPSQTVQDRIDLLAIDKEGCCVVIELKRGNNKLQMFQAITYAGMMSQWSPDDFFNLLDADKQEQLIDFLEVDIEEVNRTQKLVLVAEAFDFSLLIGAEWLNDNFGVSILCCRIALATDAESENEYLVCSNIYPTPELAQVAISRGRSRSSQLIAWNGWDAAIAGIENEHVASYYKQQIDANRESYLQKRILHYRIDGKKRWSPHARKDSAYVWQQGRFVEDIDFWSNGLSESSNIKTVAGDSCLSFSLMTKEDFDFFHAAVTKELLATVWTVGEQN
tara:strand:- start:1539 stop:2537 length:999 start_codon:yes stop_codon:yes gene_type:complete